MLEIKTKSPGRGTRALTVDQSISSTLLSFFFLFLVLFFETGFLCVALTVQELALVDQAGLELTEIQLPLTLECWD